MVRILFMVFVGFLLLVALYGSAKTQFTPFSFFGALGVLLLTALLTSVLFPRFFGKGDEKLERRILGDRFEYHDQIRGFIQSVQYYTEVDALLKDVHSLLAHTVKVRSYHIILLDETTRAFALTQSFPDRPQAQLANLRGNSPVFEFFQRTQAECLACGMTYATPGETPSERSAREQIAEFQAEFCFPFLFDQGFLGLLLIGEKVSGEPYTAHDLNLLILLARNLSRTIYQLRLKKQVRLAEELELLGRMSRGMAHDLNNLLVPVSTLLQLCGDTAAHRTHIQELLPIATRNLATMQAYIREALFFSQHHTPQIAPGRLDLLLHKAAELAEPKLQRRKVEVVISSEEYITVEMDSVLIQRLISNILSNAIDASAPGSKVFLELRLLARTEPRRDWLRIRVIDHGDGISPENLARIASPYFTTKDKGDETRGFGLGLSICRKIVHLHGGTLRIFSEEMKGTMVQVDLPSRHIKAAPTLMAVAT
jgi:signal transduction histidine kinase